MKELINIITIVNDKTNIKECILSVKAQTYTNIKHILVSTDPIINKYLDLYKIKYYSSIKENIEDGWIVNLEDYQKIKYIDSIKSFMSMQYSDDVVYIVNSKHNRRIIPHQRTIELHKDDITMSNYVIHSKNIEHISYKKTAYDNLFNIKLKTQRLILTLIDKI